MGEKLSECLCGCGKSLGPGKRKYATDACSRAMQLAQLKAQGGRRKAERALRIPAAAKCDVCGVEFKPTSGRQRYCADESCKKRGLALRVEEQRRRREVEKAARDKNRQAAAARWQSENGLMTRSTAP